MIKKILSFILSLVSVGYFSYATSPILSPIPTANKKNEMSQNKCMILTLKDGDVSINLRSDLAPHHVARIIELTNKGFYDGLKFHRVIAGFMAQTGDPKGDGTGGSGQNLKAEFSGEKHVRGTVSMARAASPDSADSQFFIMFAPASYLDGQYTIFGEVVKGMEFVDKIKKGNSNNNGTVTDPDKIIKAKITDSCK